MYIVNQVHSFSSVVLFLQYSIWFPFGTRNCDDYDVINKKKKICTVNTFFRMHHCEYLVVSFLIKILNWQYVLLKTHSVMFHAVSIPNSVFVMSSPGLGIDVF